MPHKPHKSAANVQKIQSKIQRFWQNVASQKMDVKLDFKTHL